MIAGNSKDMTGLAGKIITKLKSRFGKKLDVNASAQFVDAISEAIVEYIKQEASIVIDTINDEPADGIGHID